MNVINKINKANRNRFASSTISKSSFNSMLESIHQTDGNLQDEDQSISDFPQNSKKQFKNLKNYPRTTQDQKNNRINRKQFIKPNINKVLQTDKFNQILKSQSFVRKKQNLYKTSKIQQFSQFEENIHSQNNQSESQFEIIEMINQGFQDFNKKQKQSQKNEIKRSKNNHQKQQSQQFIHQSQITQKSQPNIISNNKIIETTTNRPSNSIYRNTISSYIDSSSKDKDLYERHLRTLSLRPKTTKRIQPVKQFTIAIIEYCSHEIGLACYNNTTGQIFLCQLVENMTYFRTLSTIQIFYPIQIIYPNSLEHTLLIKKLMQQFNQSSFKSVQRRNFDDICGESLYKETTSHEDFNLSNKFLAFACFNALLMHLQNSLQTNLKHKALKVNWHRLDELLIIEPDSITDLQIFYNYESKKQNNCLINNFKCITYGGTRLLRANLLQPPASQKIIQERQNLVQKLLQNPSLMSSIQKQFYKYKYYEPVTAKFIHNPRHQNIKSLKSFISSIFTLSNQCMSLQKLYKTFQQSNSFSLPIFDKLDQKLQNPKLKILRSIIQENFDQNILKIFEEVKNKKDKFIFLFKAQKIQSSGVQMMRSSYIMTVQNIKQQYNLIRRKSHENIQLMYNDYRGYFLKAKQDINLQNLAQSLGQNLVQISLKGKSLTFSTQILASLNNRLKQAQKVLILQCQSLLIQIINKIQQNIDILFQINSSFSTIDMVIAFVRYIQKFSQFAKFTKPKIIKNQSTFKIQNIKPIWTLRIDSPFNEQLSTFSIIKQSKQKSIIVLQKAQNSIQQNNFMYSMAYSVILNQIGCFIPAENVQICLFQTILSKIQLQQHTQIGLSRFQLTLIKIQNILNNCFDQNQGNCLVLIDQIIKGTQHQEQCALSLGIILELQKNKGISLINTSDRVLIKYLQSFQEFKNVKILRTKQYIIQQEAIQHMTLQAINLMKDFNFNQDFIQYFQEIQTVYKDVN